jgi:branched-subunit amino acid aminotransferase/4-amino-4-deoxychorismate lyase
VGELLAADSWRVEGGRVVAFAEHRRRFEGAVAAAAAGHVDWPAFWAAVVGAVPAAGGWWPRVELRGGGRPEVVVRPAPQRRACTRLVWDGRADPRRSPRAKGPDLSLLGRLRAQAVAAGGDCALLTGPGGAVREAATGSVLWWEGEVLCAPADDGVLPAVTAGLVLGRARATGVATDRRDRRPEELAGREVWFTSALHGVTGVCELRAASGAVALGTPRRAAAWHRWWTSRAQPWGAAAPGWAPAPGSLSAP